MGVCPHSRYYPFGLAMAGISSKALNGAAKNRLKYNGIEFENDLELNTYDTYYRDLDPQTGRWWQMDPKIENMEAWSPYASNFDNPIAYSDPLGDEPGDGDAPSAGSVTSNFVFGVGQSLLGTVEGVGNAIAHPIETAKGIGSALAHPVETAKAISNVASETYTEFRNGNADIKANILGKVIGEVGQVLVGAAAVKAGTALIRGVKVASVAEHTSILARTAEVAKGLGNPFKRATLGEVRNSFEKRVAQGTMEKEDQMLM